MQTAVEWLIIQIKNDHIDKALKGWEWLKIFEQAKEMEEQQRKDDYLAGLNAKETIEYYNETYGSKGSDELGSSLEWNGEVTQGSDGNFKQFSLYEHKETIATADTPTSSQTEISEHRFTEKDIRFAYMQGYNRGVDGNPNHMESYIEHLKKKQ